MGRAARVDVADLVYHVLNRANGRLPLFESAEDYRLFEEVLEQAKERIPMRILAYCIIHIFRNTHYQAQYLIGNSAKQY
jgi:putative transposase